MAFKSNNQQGIVKTIIILIIALLILSYYGFNLRSTVESPTTQNNFSYAWGGVVYVWDTYLAKPATYFYNLFVNDIWDPSIRDIESINAHQTPSAEQNLPQQYPGAPTVQ